MAEYGTPLSRSQVRRAGELLRSASVSAGGSAGADALQGPERDAIRVLERWRDLHAPVLVDATRELRRMGSPLDASIAARLKATASMLAKLSRSPRSKLDTMQDVAGCRIVLPDLDSALEVSARCGESMLAGFSVVRFYDHLSIPRPTGYRAHHLVLRHEERGLLVEVQVRSMLQHRWASLVEDLGRRFEQPLKHGHGDPYVLQHLAELAAVIADIDRGRRQGPSVASMRGIQEAPGALGPDLGAEMTHD
jgi:putative GTP pyrophosphokinase